MQFQFSFFWPFLIWRMYDGVEIQLDGCLCFFLVEDSNEPYGVTEGVQISFFFSLTPKTAILLFSGTLSLDKYLLVNVVVSFRL